MNYSHYAIISFILWLITGVHFANAQTLDGLWKSQSGTIYNIRMTGALIVGTYEVPNAAQIAAGIQKGDLAIKGSFIPNVLTGTYYQRAPLKIQELCPEFKVIDTPIQWETNGPELTGSLLLISGTDSSCNVTGRRLQQMKLLREADTRSVRTSDQGIPLPWPFPW